jgi:hypothetical protein
MLCDKWQFIQTGSEWMKNPRDIVSGLKQNNRFKCRRGIVSQWTFQVGLNVTVDEMWVDITSRHSVVCVLVRLCHCPTPCPSVCVSVSVYLCPWPCPSVSLSLSIFAPIRLCPFLCSVVSMSLSVFVRVHVHMWFFYPLYFIPFKNKIGIRTKHSYVDSFGHSFFIHTYYESTLGWGSLKL